MKIFFSVGEPSGDIHGANLIRALRSQSPDVECVGFGGPKMVAAGFTSHADLTQLAVMWFLRVVLNLHRFLLLLMKADRYFRSETPDAVILIDYPGFNWWVARRAKAHGIPVYYFGVPQIWAWAPWRIRKMRRLVDHVMCKLPFEEPWYRARGCNATYVGHPYFDETERHETNVPFVRGYQERPGPLLTLLPGSRNQEVTANVDVFLTTVEVIQHQLPELNVAVAAFDASHAEYCRRAIRLRSLQNVTVHVGCTPELIQASTVCLACSGSVSLELLHYLKPTVIHYRIGWLAYRVQRYFRTVRFITLVNLLASNDRFCQDGEQYDPQRDEVPFPEYLTCTDQSQVMADHLLCWLQNPQTHQAVVQQLRELKQSFAVPGASRSAARYILSTIACGDHNSTSVINGDCQGDAA